MPSTVPPSSQTETPGSPAPLPNTALLGSEVLTTTAAVPLENPALQPSGLLHHAGLGSFQETAASNSHLPLTKVK